MTAEHPTTVSREAVARPDRLVSAVRDEGVDAAAAAARRLIDALLRVGDHPDTDMAQVTKQLDALADQLTERAPGLEDRLVVMWQGTGITRHDPVTGPENALAPPLELTGRDDGSVQGTVTLGLPYQGPPRCVHGGVSALLLDHTLGVANHWAGLSGMTAELTLRYLRPTPLFEPLTVTGRQVSADGRKIRAIGSITAGGRECVTAEGLFIARQLPRPS
ncbi:PaaI family thioesterase [Streptomyces sp. H51]|uniref:PaaI family thioesterase n=1 Tax=Streptomyces sp. H51 TaxID=3111770 RepID=UPI002D7788C4|nr:PaaI family thioesterase [Streptomyces sp. H51]